MAAVPLQRGSKRTAPEAKAIGAASLQCSPAWPPFSQLTGGVLGSQEVLPLLREGRALGQVAPPHPTPGFSRCANPPGARVKHCAPARLSSADNIPAEGSSWAFCSLMYINRDEYLCEVSCSLAVVSVQAHSGYRCWFRLWVAKRLQPGPCTGGWGQSRILPWAETLPIPPSSSQFLLGALPQWPSALSPSPFLLPRLTSAWCTRARRWPRSALWCSVLGND